jgi:hypothetical protein
MAIKSQQIIGIAGAFVLVGAALWAGSVLLDPSPGEPGVATKQAPERAWVVEITDLGAIEAPPEKRTASANR